LTDFSKNAQTSNFINIRPAGVELFHADGRTDGQTDRQTDRQTDMPKLIFALHKLANVTKKEKTRTRIDVAIPADINIVQKEAEKKLKYKHLCTEIP